MGSKFAPAGQAEMIRCVKKDEQYLQQLRNDVGELFQKFFGIRQWINHKPSLDVFSNLLYFSLTTLAGYQTLGEEYVNMVAVDPTRRNVPSFLRRATVVVLYSAGPLLHHLALSRLERTLKPLQDMVVLGKDTLGLKVRHLVSALRWLTCHLPRLHLLLFYFFGTHYHLSYRVAGVHYVLLRRWLADGGGHARLYRLLGWLSLTQFVLSLVLEVCNFRLATSSPDSSTEDRSSGNNSVVYSSRETCQLCLDRRKDSTVTPCGHLFCWGCITRWMESKWECPLCREKFPVSRLVYLQNFD